MYLPVQTHLEHKDWKEPSNKGGQQRHNCILTREATSSVGESDSYSKTRSSHRKLRSTRHRRLALDLTRTSETKEGEM